MTAAIDVPGAIDADAIDALCADAPAFESRTLRTRAHRLASQCKLRSIALALDAAEHVESAARDLAMAHRYAALGEHAAGGQFLALVWLARASAIECDRESRAYRVEYLALLQGATERERAWLVRLERQRVVTFADLIGGAK